MTGEEVRKMRDEEIGIALKKTRDQLYTLRTQMVTEKVENTAQIGELRRDVARLLTERRSRELAKA